LADKPVEASKGLRQAMGKTADWNMAVYDFERYNMLLKVADELAVRVRLFDPSSIRDYYSVLKQIYINWRELMEEKTRKEFDGRFEKIRDNIFRLKDLEATEEIENEETSIKMHIPVDLESIHEDLLGFKQRVGMGVPTRREITEEERLARGMQ
jgi:DNA-binding transcriptional regulator GbsR (MarR family)